MASTLIKGLRGATSLALFAAFGIGALALSPLMLILAKPERCQPIVRFIWRPLLGLFVHTRLIRVEGVGLSACRGTILVANHPSLIDVVILTVLIPRTISISKSAARHNPVMGAVVRAATLPVDADLSGVTPYLARGWNILIFPEGTRSPTAGTDPLHPFHRGAAQLALRSGAPIRAIGISPSRRILAKRQPVWDMGTDPVVYRLRADAATVVAPNDGESLHAAARRVTADLERRIKDLIA